MVFAMVFPLYFTKMQIEQSQSKLNETNGREKMRRAKPRATTQHRTIPRWRENYLFLSKNLSHIGLVCLYARAHCLRRAAPNSLACEEQKEWDLRWNKTTANIRETHKPSTGKAEEKRKSEKHNNKKVNVNAGSAATATMHGTTAND